VLRGLDRIVFRGVLSRLLYPEGLAAFLNRQGCLLKDFGHFVQETTGALRSLAAAAALRLGRPVHYLESSSVSKEEVARKSFEESPVKKGLVGLLSCVEPCMTWQVFRSRENKTQELRRKWAKCLVEGRAVEDEVLALEPAAGGLDALLGEFEQGGDLARSIKREPVLVGDGNEEEVEQRLGPGESREEPVAHEAPIDPAEPVRGDRAPACRRDEALLDAGHAVTSSGRGRPSAPAAGASSCCAARGACRTRASCSSRRRCG
jgi:hypothetical protein